MAFTFIMQNIAANLGGMLTPFGNPQNLYLYSKFNIPTNAFVATMLPPFCISVTLITLCCLLVKKENLEVPEEHIQLPIARTIVYGILFALSIVIVFRVIPFVIGLIVIPLALFFLDKKALKQVDYALLFTFVAFFIFAGNMARIPQVQSLFGSLMEKSPLLVAVCSCQIISNVPSAILLSQFTSDFAPLLVGVNIGGVGTLISSLASLITFGEYAKHEPQKIGKYVLLFSLFNFAFLGVLTAVEYFIFL
jgi:Na+/H+ antiporter NhaD/arsenite permease-like protein